MRHFITYLFLGLLLFPMTEKVLHAFEHDENEHCIETEATHLHERHHDCSLCDFNFEPLHSCELNSEIIPFSKPTEAEYHFISFVSLRNHFYFSLRAPPAIG
jgi:hypothetical protein